MARLIVISLLGLVLAHAWLVPASAEPTASFRVIVNSANVVARVEKRFVAEAFLKKRTRWGDDRAIQPVDLGQKSSARSAFSRDILGRDVVSVRRYWAQLVFSGRGVPPPEGGVLPAVELPRECTEDKHEHDHKHDHRDHHDDD